MSRPARTLSVTVVAAALLSACGFPHASGPAPTRSSHPQVSRGSGGPGISGSASPPASRPFPSPIADAMQVLAPRADIPLRAPTALPAPPAGKVWAATTTVTPNANYTATLWAAPHAMPVNSPAIRLPEATPLASWSGYHTASAAAAQSLLASLSHDTPWLWAGKPYSNIALGHGTSGRLYQLPAQPAAPTVPAQPSASVVTFSARGWQVVVSTSPAGSAARDAAERVAQLLPRYPAIAAQASGTIVVNWDPGQNSGPNVETIVTWQNGSDVYQVQAAGTASAPNIALALALASSMRPYPAGS